LILNAVFGAGCKQKHCTTYKTEYVSRDFHKLSILIAKMNFVQARCFEKLIPGKPASIFRPAESTLRLLHYADESCCNEPNRTSDAPRPSVPAVFHEKSHPVIHR